MAERAEKIRIENSPRNTNLCPSNPPALSRTKMAAASVPVRDIGQLLDVSFQCASQLIKS
ncbi:hypothetical protein [Rhodococcus erythropolis]|uniref:hypothetical protein n=1 Tax=Rhodococcus erythropolis TaxID=1833 RepID=UPI00366ACEC6